MKRRKIPKQKILILKQGENGLFQTISRTIKERLKCESTMAEDIIMTLKETGKITEHKVFIGLFQKSSIYTVNENVYQ